jgi:hypothetical protein
MRNRLAACAFLASLAAGAPVRAAGGREGPGDKPRPPAVKVTVDVADFPDLAVWAREAKGLVEKWHPRISDYLASDGFTPPGEIKIFFKLNIRDVAYTQGATIVVSVDWMRKHPEDFGVIIHELTHAIQAYPATKRRDGWLVEGIADYVRFFQYEPNVKLTLDPRRASYRDGYRTAAMFLAWVEKTHGEGIIRRLNEALRKREYSDELFKTCTSKTLDELWETFIASMDRK